jgi:hypothetical protein
MNARARAFLQTTLLLYVVFAGATCSAQEGAEVPPLLVPQYIAELDRIESATSKLVRPEDASPLIASIPTSWRVQDGPTVYWVSSEWLRSDLAAWQKNPKSEFQERSIFHLGVLRSEVVSLQLPQSDVSQRRAALSQILASPEFSAVHGPTWWDRLKQRFVEWLFHLLSRFFSSSAIPTISNVLVYGLIGIAALALAYWIYRTIRDNAGVETILPGTLPVSSKEWSVWMAEARAAADAGNWRDAVHLAYWCGISFLEAQGWWPPDRARTPREYLRLLPSSSEHQPALRALTRGFEIIWYGTQEADARAFSETVAQLEKLGCQYR